MTIAQMKARKIELGLTSEMIAEKSGVPLGTVQKIFGGITKAPRKKTIDAIAQVLCPPPEKSYASPYLEGTRIRLVREPLGLYDAVPDESRKTIEDYYALPEEQRVELIDGVFYDMGAPSMTHQKILGDLHILFRECVDRHKELPCEVYLAPCDVRLDRDNYTIVQPDLLVICGKYDQDAIRYEGAPNLVVEILSPSTRRKDLTTKLLKYCNAGVQEYWVIDPKHKSIIVHYFDEEDYEPKKYSFQDEIPIEISGGLCRIDFSRIDARLS